MNTTTTPELPLAAPAAPQPMKTTTTYTQTLRDNQELMLRLAQEHKQPSGKTNWEKITELHPELLVGPGPKSAQLRRLVNAYRQFTGKIPKTSKRGGSGTYEGSQAQLFDQHRQRIEVMAQTYRTPAGSTAWKRALENSPDIANDIGYAGMDKAARKRLVINLTTWYRDRTGKRGPRVRVEAHHRNGPGWAAAQPQASPVQTAHVAAPASAEPKRPRFCAHCGEPILYATPTR